MQTATYTIARADTGVVLPYAKVTVYQADGITPATIYDPSGGSTGNPLTADNAGNISFGAPDGSYILAPRSADGAYTAPVTKVALFDAPAMNAAIGAAVTATAANAALAMQAALVTQGFSNTLSTNPAALPYEVTALTLGAAGSGATVSGEFALTVSGGPAGHMASVIVSGGAITGGRIINPGLSTSNTAPTYTLPTIAGLTGAGAPTATVGAIPVNRVFRAPSPDGTQFLGWTNNAGSLSQYPTSGTQFAEYAKGGIDASLGTTTASGTNPPVAGTGGSTGSLVDATAFGAAGVLVSAIYATADGWAWPYTTSLNGDGTVKSEQIGNPVRVYAGQVAWFSDFTPDVTATQYFGVMTDQSCIGVNNAATGKTTWSVTGGIVPASLTSGSTGKTPVSNYRMQVYWAVVSGTLGQQIKDAAARARSDFGLGTALATIGTFPAVDGTTGFSGGYQIFSREPAPYDGWISPSVYLAGIGTGYFVVCSRNSATGTFNIAAKESAIRTFAAGANSPGVLPLRIRRGQFVGVYFTGAVRAVASGIGSYFIAGAPGAVGTSQTLTYAATTPMLSYQIVPSLDGETSRATAAEAAIQTQFDGSLTTQGSTVDGAATVGSGNLTMFAELPISQNGLLKTVYFGAAGTGSGKLVLCSKNGSNQFTLIKSMDVACVAGANSAVTPWRDCAGLYIGFYASAALQRYTSTGGPGARWTGGLPGANTASTNTGASAWLLAIGWDIQTGVNPRLVADEARLDALEAAATAPSSALIYRTATPLGTPLGAATIYAAGYYGQSNSADFYQGTTPSSVITSAQPYSNVMYSGGSLVPLVSVTTEKSYVTAANFATARRVKKTGTGTSQVLAGWTAGVGGASISALQSGSTGYTNYMARLNEVKAIQPSVQPILNFIQGETDTEAGMTGTTWSGYMTTLRSALEASVNASTGRTDPLYCVLTQPAYKVALNKEVVLAQLTLAQTDPKFFLSCPMYRMPYSSYDSIHMINVGYKLLGAYNGKANDAIIRGEKPQWLNPVSATYDGAKVVLKFDVPVQPLVLDATNLGLATNYGFKVLDNGSAATISSVVAGPDTVTITCSASFTGPVVVRYALDYLGAGLNITSGASGNLRDSDPDTITISGTVWQLFNAAPHFELTAVNVGV